MLHILELFDVVAAALAYQPTTFAWDEASRELVKRKGDA